MVSREPLLTIVFASHTVIGSTFVVGSHHLAREMARLGHRVLHLSTPITFGHLLKFNDSIYRSRFSVWARGGVEVDAGVINYVPFSLIPWNIAGFIFRCIGVNLHINTFVPSLRRIMCLHGLLPDKVDILIIDQPRFAGLEQYIKASVVIYRATDLYREMTGDSSLDFAEEFIIKKANGVVGTSEPVLKKLMQYGINKPWLLLENGVEFEHFSHNVNPPEEYSEIPRPRVIYVGALDERFDIYAIREIATKLHSISIILIGPYNNKVYSFLKSFPNVYLLGAKSYLDLPAYLNHADVGLLPLSDHPANIGRSPMKLYEYAASGLPVVAKETHELLRRKEPFVYFYRNIKDLPEIVQYVLQYHKDNRDAIRALARAHSWKNKAKQLLDFALKIKWKDFEVE